MKSLRFYHSTVKKKNKIKIDKKMLLLPIMTLNKQIVPAVLESNFWNPITFPGISDNKLVPLRLCSSVFYVIRSFLLMLNISLKVVLSGSMCVRFCYKY